MDVFVNLNALEVRLLFLSWRAADVMCRTPMIRSKRTPLRRPQQSLVGRTPARRFERSLAPAATGAAEPDKPAASSTDAPAADAASPSDAPPADAPKTGRLALFQGDWRALILRVLVRLTTACIDH